MNNMDIWISRKFVSEKDEKACKNICCVCVYGKVLYLPHIVRVCVTPCAHIFLTR